MSSPPASKRLRYYTSIPFEIFIIAFTLLPILVLIYFYPKLPARIPVFLNFRGEVEVWAAKSVFSVFRVPLMAVDLQLICLLMKYGTVQFKPEAHASADAYQDKLARLRIGIWDWFRGAIAVKMSAESLSILFLDDPRLSGLKTISWAVIWIATITGIVGALVYGYRLFVVKREIKRGLVAVSVEKRVGLSHVYGRLFYWNPSDRAVFVDKYGLNFGNKWSYALLACVAAYPVLVFSAM